MNVQPYLRIRVPDDPNIDAEGRRRWAYDRDGPGTEMMGHFLRWALANKAGDLPGGLEALDIDQLSADAYYRGSRIIVSVDGWVCPCCNGAGEYPFEDRARVSMRGTEHYTTGGGGCYCCDGLGYFEGEESYDDACGHDEDGMCCVPEPEAMV